MQNVEFWNQIAYSEAWYEDKVAMEVWQRWSNFHAKSVNDTKPSSSDWEETAGGFEKGWDDSDVWGNFDSWEEEMTWGSEAAPDGKPEIMPYQESTTSSEEWQTEPTYDGIKVCSTNRDIKWTLNCSEFEMKASENCTVDYWQSSCGPHMCMVNDGGDSFSCLPDMMDQGIWLGYLEPLDVWNFSKELHETYEYWDKLHYRPDEIEDWEDYAWIGDY